MKEELNNIVCQSSSDYEILDNAYDYIEKLEEENKSLQSQLKEKEEVIKEAREYVEELYDNTDDTTCYDIDKHRKDDLLEILSKGENK